MTLISASFGNQMIRVERIIHVSSSGASLDGGMSRVSYHWLEAFRKRGIETISVDPTNTRPPRHGSLLDLALRESVIPRSREGDILLVHEPLGGSFVGLNHPLVVFSHGIEARLAEVEKKFGIKRKGLKSIITRPLWARRERATKLGLKMADLVLVLNREDRAYLEASGSCGGEIFVYRNGVSQVNANRATSEVEGRVLFLGTWIARKGITLVANAYRALRNSGSAVKWRFAGTQVCEAEVRQFLGANGDSNVEVIPKFAGCEEDEIFEDCNVFVLPSYMEGQPLALLEAMNRGFCCITTDADGQRDLIVDRVSGLLFPVGEVEKFVKLLEEVLDSADLRARLGAEARLVVQSRKWDVVSDEVVDAVLSTTSRA